MTTEENIDVVNVDKFEDLHPHLKKGWIYRGQRDSNWEIKTSFERLCDSTPIKSADREFVERALIRDFKRSFHHYSSNCPDDSSTIEWLSIMQHHGAPTRLVDFSYSPYVAAYFAIEDAISNDENSMASIWAIDQKWAMETSSELLKSNSKKNPKQLLKYTDLEAEKHWKHYFYEQPFIKLAMPVNPFKLNERLRIQRGIFMCTGDIGHSFKDNLVNMPGHKDHVEKINIKIDRKFRQEALRTLNDMGISRTNLFPGIDGFAQSLARYHVSFCGKPDWMTP